MICLLKVNYFWNNFLGSSSSSKKRMKKFDFTTMIPQVDLFSFVFWRKSMTPKNRYEINWPLIGPIWVDLLILNRFHQSDNQSWTYAFFSCLLWKMHCQNFVKSWQFLKEKTFNFGKTKLKVGWFWNIFLLTSILPKKQLENFDFCHDLLWQKFFGRIERHF